MPSSRPYLRLLRPHLLLLFAGLAGCGPASSDNAPGVEPRASVSPPPLSSRDSAPGINSMTPVTLAANPGSLASAKGTGAVGGLVDPAKTARELASPNVAAETWAQSASLESVDPLIQALSHTDQGQLGAEALIEEQEYQDLLEEQEKQGLVVEQENQDPDGEGENGGGE